MDRKVEKPNWLKSKNKIIRYVDLVVDKSDFIWSPFSNCVAVELILSDGTDQYRYVMNINNHEKSDFSKFLQVNGLTCNLKKLELVELFTSLVKLAENKQRVKVKEDVLKFNFNYCKR